MDGCTGWWVSMIINNRLRRLENVANKTELKKNKKKKNKKKKNKKKRILIFRDLSLAAFEVKV
jgi:hypothetical protein